MAVRQIVPNGTSYLGYTDNAENNENIPSTISASDFTVQPDYYYNPLTDQTVDGDQTQVLLGIPQIPRDRTPNAIAEKCSNLTDPDAYGACITSFQYPIGQIPGPVYFPPPVQKQDPIPLTKERETPPATAQFEKIKTLNDRTKTVRTANINSLKNTISNLLNDGNNIGFEPCNNENTEISKINSDISQINDINNAANTMLSELKDLQELTKLYQDVQKHYEIRLNNLTTQYFSLKGDQAKQIENIDKTYNAQIAIVKKEKDIVDEEIIEKQDQVANYQLNIIPNTVNMYNYGAFYATEGSNRNSQIHEELGNNLTEYYNQVVKQNSNMENQLATEKAASITNNREAEQMTATLTTVQTTKSYIYYIYYALLLVILMNVYYQKTRFDMIVQSVILVVLFLLPILGGVIELKIYEFLSYSASLIFGTVYKNRNTMYNENNSSEPIDYNKNTEYGDIRQPRSLDMFTYIYANYLESMPLWEVIAITSAIGLGGFMYLYTRSR